VPLAGRLDNPHLRRNHRRRPSQSLRIKY
jgi:hypothetical protein